MPIRPENRGGYPADRRETRRPPTAGRLVASPAMRAIAARLVPPAWLAAPSAEPEQQQTKPVAAALGPNKRARRVAAYKTTHQLLVARYPHLFTSARPLALGTHDKLRAAFSEEKLSNTNLSMFLARWTRRKPYQNALARGDRRVNLDGSDAGPAFAPQPRWAEW